MEDLTAIKRMPINKDAAPGISQTRGDNVRLVNGSPSAKTPPLKANLVMESSMAQVKGEK